MHRGVFLFHLNISVNFALSRIKCKSFFPPFHIWLLIDGDLVLLKLLFLAFSVFWTSAVLSLGSSVVTFDQTVLRLNKSPL